MSDADWQTIETAPKDTPVLVHSKPWGVIVATLSGEFDQWMSRMQVPVSLGTPEDVPTHWRPMPPMPPGFGPEAGSAPASTPPSA